MPTTTKQSTKISDERIAERAYQIWQQRGCPEGNGSRDWQEAKKQLLTERANRGRGPLLRLFDRILNRAAL